MLNILAKITVLYFFCLDAKETKDQDCRIKAKNL
jgi:hypothetical protein